MLDVELLSRVQFAFTIAFHYIFPPMSIGLGVLLVAWQALSMWTGKPVYERTARFWLKVFGLIFVMGVATGIVMEFQFGTNWAAYSRYVGDVFGGPLAAEVITAFFMESAFVGLLVLGWDRIGPRTRLFSFVMAALGAHLSALWIVVANSWQQTPAGFRIVGEGLAARAELTGFWAAVLNPSTFDRVSHVFCGAWQAGAFLVISISAFYVLLRWHTEFAKASMKPALCLALASSLGQLGTGHTSAIGVAKNQPAKLAAFEGHYEASAPGDLYMFGWVDEKAERVRFAPGLPGFLSFLVHFDFKKPVTGLKAFPPEDRPPVNLVFQAYHAMVGIGMGLIGLSLAGVFFWWRGTLFQQTWLQVVFLLSFLGPQIANQMGWISAEVGRQPWVVYGVLRTSEAFSKVVPASQVLASIALFGLVYALLFLLFVFLLGKEIIHGPEEEDLEPAGVAA
ncbi:MAG: cytochrome ubiquinol oxidase subunit I [Elusimicrobiota bacterium]